MRIIARIRGAFAGTLLLKRALEKPSPLAGGAVALASTAAAVEVFAWSERHADSPVAKALKRPGYGRITSASSGRANQQWFCCAYMVPAHH
jgi:hypothetical protein